MKPNKFSLDYVVSGSRAEPNAPSQSSVSPPASSVTSSALDEATLVYSQPIFQQLQAAPRQQMRLHDLIDQVGLSCRVSSFEEFQGVIGLLIQKNLLKTAETDLKGNHLIELVRLPKT